MHRLNRGRMFANFEERMQGHLVNAAVNDFAMLSKTLAKVVVTFSTNSRPNAELAYSVTQALDGRAEPIQGSFRWIGGRSLPTAVGFVRVNASVRPFEEAANTEMKALASNMLMDRNDESLWEVRGNGDSRMLVRVGNEDLSELLVTASHSNRTGAHKLDSVYSMTSPGEFVAFVDPQLEMCRYGYVLSMDSQNDSVEVVEAPMSPDEMDQGDDLNGNEEMRGEGNKIAQRMSERDAPVNVGLDCLYESCRLNGTDTFKEIAEPATKGKQHLIDYYKRVFSYAPEYFEDVKRIINERSAM